MYIISPVKVDGINPLCFNAGSTAWIGRDWRTPAVLSGAIDTPTFISSAVDNWGLVPSFTGPDDKTGTIKFAIACGVTGIDFKITFDRDSSTDASHVIIKLDDVELIRSESISDGSTNGTTTPHFWLLAGDSTLNFSLTGLQSTACGAILEIEGRMENSGTSQTYIDIEVTGVTSV